MNGLPAPCTRRRHLDESQRAVVADKIATMRQGERTDLSEISERFSQRDAADLMNVSVDLAGFARKVRTDGAPELVQAVERGDLSVSFAGRCGRLASCSVTAFRAQSTSH